MMKILLCSLALLTLSTTLSSCGLVKQRPTHPDVKKYNVAGHWTSKNGETLYISCAGRIEIDYNNPLDLKFYPRVGWLQLKPIKHHLPKDEIMGDIKQITDSQIVYWALWTQEFDDFVPPGNGLLMKLDGRTWITKSQFECD